MDGSGQRLDYLNSLFFVVFLVPTYKIRLYNDSIELKIYQSKTIQYKPQDASCAGKEAAL